MKLGFKQTSLSIALFAAVLVALVSFDDRVRQQFEVIYNDGNGLSSWTNRAMSTGDLLLGVARYQSIEHGSLAVFAVISVVLVLFMVKS